MTPPAVTTAGRGTTAGHRSTLRPAPGPRRPRRVSGPVRGRVAPRPARPQTLRSRGLAVGALRRLLALPDHPLLDRIVRGRAWIALLGVMLAGIVAMQVEVLKLGAGIGRSIQQAQALNGRNELLRAQVAGLGDDGRIEALAAKMGMVMPGPTQVGFLSASGTSVSRALAGIHPPDTANFATQSVSNGGVVTAAVAPPAAGSGSGSSQSAGSGSGSSQSGGTGQGTGG